MARVTGYQKMFAAHAKERAKLQAAAPARATKHRAPIAERITHTMTDIKVSPEIRRIFEYVFNNTGVVREAEVRCGPVKDGPVTVALHYNGFLGRTMQLAEGAQRLDFSGHVVRAGDRIEVFARSDADALIESLTIGVLFEAIPS